MLKPSAKRRKHFHVDMGALCDVAFLMLFFFVLSGKPKPWLPVKINAPFSIPAYNCALTDVQRAEIILGEGKLLYFIGDAKVCQQTILQMCRKYQITFSHEEVSKWGKIKTIGVAVSALKRYTDKYGSGLAVSTPPGIPVTSAGGELETWISESRKACQSIYHRDLPIVINADERTPYPQIEYAMNILVRQHIYMLHLLTNTKNL